MVSRTKQPCFVFVFFLVSLNLTLLTPFLSLLSIINPVKTGKQFSKSIALSPEKLVSHDLGRVLSLSLEGPD